MIKRPMLAGKVNLSTLKYPCLVTPKLDGIRALKLKANGPLVSRNFKPFRNKEISAKFRWLPAGVDGELVIPSTRFNEISSAVMGEFSDTSKVEYWIFDWFGGFNEGKGAYYDRINSLDGALSKAKDVAILIYQTINNEEELLAYESAALKEGHEGIMIRSPNGPYKEGRSTTKEGYLLKLKRFEDGEGIILGFEERLTNQNEQTRDAFGLAKRSSHQAGKQPTGMLGALQVKDLESGTEFSLGTGFDEALRKEIWLYQDTFIGRVVKYKWQACGTVDRPRFPVFLGFRS
jgi:DNA ligase-1